MAFQGIAVHHGGRSMAMQPDEELAAMNEYAIRGMQSIPLSRGHRYVTKQFSGNRGMRVIFRKLGQNEDEHWLNHFAALITAYLLPPYNKPPYSNNCHTELVMDIAPGCTVRIGTMFKFAEKNEAGETVWKPGKAFVSEISEGELAKYETLLMPSTREMETRMLCFALRNLGAPFHETAYKMRALFPITPGVSAYDPVANDVRNKEYAIPKMWCTNHTVLCLQAAAYEKLRCLRAGQMMVPSDSVWNTGWESTIMDQNATGHTPNKLYYLLKSLSDVRVAGSRPDQRFRNVGTL